MDAAAVYVVAVRAELKYRNFSPVRVRIDDPVGRDAELLVRCLLPVQVDQRGAR
jgi:hypothetical protein